MNEKASPREHIYYKRTPYITHYMQQTYTTIHYIQHLPRLKRTPYISSSKHTQLYITCSQHRQPHITCSTHTQCSKHTHNHILHVANKHTTIHYMQQTYTQPHITCSTCQDLAGVLIIKRTPSVRTQIFPVMYILIYILFKEKKNLCTMRDPKHPLP